MGHFPETFSTFFPLTPAWRWLDQIEKQSFKDILLVAMYLLIIDCNLLHKGKSCLDSSSKASFPTELK